MMLFGRICVKSKPFILIQTSKMSQSSIIKGLTLKGHHHCTCLFKDSYITLARCFPKTEK